MSTNKNKNKAKKRRLRMLLWAAGIDDVTALSKIIGKSRQYTSDVLYGNKAGHPVRSAIALALGVAVEKLWPENGHKKAA